MAELGLSNVLVGTRLLHGALLSQPPRPPVLEIARYLAATEYLCLYDKVWTFGDSWQARAADDLLVSATELWSLARAEGAFGSFGVSDAKRWADNLPANSPTEWSEQQKEHFARLVGPVAKGTSPSDQKEARLYLGVSVMTGVPYAPDIDDVQIIRRIDPVTKSTRFYNALHEAYARLAAASRVELAALRDMGKPIDVFVPPIPALILNKVSDAAEIPEATMELRRKLRSVRSAFAEYEAVVRDPETSLQESLGARRRLSHISESLSRPFGSPNRLNITEWRDIAGFLEKSLEDPGSPSLSAILLSRPVKALIGLLRDRRVIYLYRLRDRFLKIHEYSQLLRKVFRVKLNSEDVDLLNASAGRLDGLIQAIGTE